jgi:serine/threonine-protein kinase
VASAVVAALLWRGPGSSGGTAHAATPAIAVLSFEMIGPADDAYLSAGVTEEITTGLAQVQGVRVLSRATVRAYADSNFTPTDFATKVGVRALVEGSVQRAGGQLRVTARLVDTRDGSAIWSDRYERAVADVFRTQQEISTAVAGALSRHLGLAGSAPRAEYVADAAAYDLYLRGRYALRERGEQGLRSAMALFSEAAQRDPAFARAHAGIAEAATLLPIYSAVPRASVADTIRASAARAIALDSLLASPHVSLGLLEKGLGRWSEGERAFVAALALDPNDAPAHQNLGELYFTLGRFDESRDALARAAALEPTEAAIVAEFAYALLHSGVRDSAVRTVGRAAAAAPRNPFVAYTQGVIAEYDGDLPRAAQHMRAAAEAAPIPFFRGALARALAMAGDSSGAATVRAELASLGAAPGAAFGRVIAGLPADTPDVLFAGLAAAAQERDPFLLLLPMRVTWYDRLRADARFGELARRLGLPASATQALAPRAGSAGD